MLAAGAGAGRWSPDGSEVSIFCCDEPAMVAHFLDVVTGDVRGLETPDPTLELHCEFGWSPDGERVVCEGYGLDDPSRNGIYSVRAADGGDLTRITSNPGGQDTPGEYSPDGTQLVFVRFEDDVPVGYFVTNVDGTGGPPAHSGRNGSRRQRLRWQLVAERRRHLVRRPRNRGASQGDLDRRRRRRFAGATADHTGVRGSARRGQTSTAATRRTGRRTATGSSSHGRNRTARTRPSGSSTPTEATPCRSPAAPTTTRPGDHRRQREARLAVRER